MDMYFVREGKPFNHLTVGDTINDNLLLAPPEIGFPLTVVKASD